MKSLPIDCCEDCKYLEPMYDNCGDLVYEYCKPMFRKVEHNTWESIPDWCPLKEEEE